MIKMTKKQKTRRSRKTWMEEISTIDGHKHIKEMRNMKEPMARRK